jgi:ribosomal protein L24E
MLTRGINPRKILLVASDNKHNEGNMQYLEDFAATPHKKSKPHKMSWAQADKDMRNKRQQEKMKEARKAGREAKRSIA